MKKKNYLQPECQSIQLCTEGCVLQSQDADMIGPNTPFEDLGTDFGDLFNLL